MSDQDKQALFQQMRQQLEQKRIDLVKPIADKINAAIKHVADQKSLSIVIGKNIVVYGGEDITADVLKIITGK
jgi:outer membrane protein